jgi:Tol biopolymer transport system component/predicted Ser/Thr protein kinase
MLGKIISHYRVLGELGSGGMGVVYEAEDTRLGRKVALKFLPEQLAHDASAMERLHRESRAASALNHPNICTLYDIGEHEGRPFIVMERLRGETLHQRLVAGPLPRDLVVDFGVQIADALDTAHAQGIVHRDIKPENLFVTERQEIKILDFGLAKQAAKPGAPASLGTTRAADALLTSPGSAVGTVLYMSPEQARGEELDPRTDLFSVGVVMYEMITGRRPFPGATVAVIFDAILNRAPRPLTESNRGVDAELEHIVLKALEKDRELRYQTAAELRADLKRLRRDGASGRAAAALEPSTRSHRTRRALAAGAAAVAAVGAIATFVMWPRSGLVPPSAWEQITDFADAVGSPALSPDGRMVTFLRGPRTFTTPGQVYVMVLPKGRPVQLTHDEREKMDPVFTPDGSSVVYTVPWDTWTVPVFGGQPRPWLANASAVSWVDDGRLLFSELLSGTINMRLSTADQSRTAARPVYTPAGRMGMAHRSYLSPDRRRVLVAAEMVNSPPWEWLPCRVVPFEGSAPPRDVGPKDAACTTGAWSPDGKWIYVTSNAGGANHVWRQRFPDGTPEQVTSGATEEEGIALSADGTSLITAVGTRRTTITVRMSGAEQSVLSEGRPALAISENGSPFSSDGTMLYYLQLPRISNAVGASMLAPFLAGELWRVHLDTGDSEPVLPGLSVTTFSLAPDGNWIAVTVLENGEPRLWVADLRGRAPPRRLPPAWGTKPRFTADHIYYVASRTDRWEIRRIRPDGSGDERVWSQDVSSSASTAISHDGKYLALKRRAAPEAAHRRTLSILEWKTGRERAVCNDCNGWWSDDGAWFAIAQVTGSGESVVTYLLPTRTETGLPDLPQQPFAQVADVARVAGARVVREPGDIALGHAPDTYAVVRETVHRNLYRVPLR